MSKKPKIRVFKDKAGEWRWTLIAANGEPSATSGGDGYTSSNDALRGVHAAADALFAAINDNVVIVKPRKKKAK